jgi:hypothetical protein
MRRLFLVLALLVLSSCSAPPAPQPMAAPETPPPPPAAPVEERVTGTVRVTASALNVRQEPSGDAEVLTQVKKGTELGVLVSDDSWVKVRLADGRVGWVAERFVSADGARPSAKRTQTARRSGCPADSDYAFNVAPTPSFTEDGPHGLVVVEANVNAQGTVTSTKLISNGTGDEAMAFLAEREIKSAKFSPPIRNCRPTAFIFTYRRSF